METQAELIAKSRKIALKFGSSTLADKDGHVNSSFLREFAEDAAALLGAGKQLVLISSGAQVAGLSIMDKWARKRDLHYRQALCAVGQVELMAQWQKAFAPYDLHVAQILLTRDDFGDSLRSLNLRNTLFTLVDEGLVPIINENDSVSVEEIKIGDNDTLAARSAVLWSADLLILFSDIDGLYDSNPREQAGSRLIPLVTNLGELRGKVTMGNAGTFGTGGIATKLEAAELSLSYGIPLILANGACPHALNKLASGKHQGTMFIKPV